MKITQKPVLESVIPAFGSSISYHKFNQEIPNGQPVWHYHPELELVYVKKGSGKRHIGNHISYYRHGDLILIGANVPHYGFTDRFTRQNVEIVVQFLQKNLAIDLAQGIEFQRIKDLMLRSAYGLSFGEQTRIKVGSLLEQMDIMNPFDRLIQLIKILQVLALATDVQSLNAQEVAIHAEQQDKERMKIIYDYVRLHFDEEISLEGMAALSHLTVPSFCRYFKKSTGRTFTKFVNEMRIIHACKLLSETGRPISDICHECGFNNFSHFNKQFKDITGKSPSEYRSEFKEILTPTSAVPQHWDIEL